MKTVQLLYSYLLVEKPFSLEYRPSAPTKEKRFAYSLYLDLIYLLNRLANEVRGKYKSLPLATTRFILKTEKDEQIKSLAVKYREEDFPFNACLDELRDEIKESLLFKDFEKKRSEGLTVDNFWEDVFKAIILPNERLNEIIRNLPGYSLSGVERMKEIMSTTFKNFYATKDNVDDALKSLELSMFKARDLYMRLLALPVELTHLRLDQLEQNRQKIFATKEDLNPNMRFVNNRIPTLIEQNAEFTEYVERNHLSWKVEDPELLHQLLKAVMESEAYSNYISLNHPDLTQDADFWRNIFTEVILNNVDFLEFLENKSVFWNDDIEIMTSFVIKTLKRLENPEQQDDAVMPMYKDGDNGKDAKFGAQLFNYVVRNKDIYRKYIQDALAKDKWETDRLAFMDVVITMAALAEIINYPEIPIAVSVNEYLEIAKSYSSAKSAQFINGLLASILPRLEEEGVMRK